MRVADALRPLPGDGPAMREAFAEMQRRADALVARLRAEDAATRAASKRIGRQIEALQFRFTGKVDDGRRPGEGKARFEEDAR